MRKVYTSVMGVARELYDVMCSEYGLRLRLHLSMPLSSLLDATFDLDNGMHLLLGRSDGVGPSPCWDLALVQLVDLGCGTAVKCQSVTCFLLVRFWESKEGKKVV